MMVSYNTFFGAKLTDGVLILVVVDDGLVLLMMLHLLLWLLVLILVVVDDGLVRPSRKTVTAVLLS